MTPIGKARLNTCHPDLVRLFVEVDKEWPCYILEGHRGMEAQEDAFAAGKSKKHYPDGEHNAIPSNAVDAGPAPDPYHVKRCREFAKLVLDVAERLGLAIRWGGDWDGDGDTKDQTFNDLVHFELKPTSSP